MPDAEVSTTWALRRVEQISCDCVEAAQVDGIGVSLVTKEGNRGVVFSTNEVAARIEELQFSLGSGPCVDAATSGSTVLLADIDDPTEGIAGAWPVFLTEVATMGVRGIFALPLRIGAIALGTMDLYRNKPGGLRSEQLRAALVAADAIAAALLGLNEVQGKVGDGHGDWSPHLIVVHQAAGMMSIQLGVTIQEALIRLRATAFSEQRAINDLASDVVASRRRFTKEDS